MSISKKKKTKVTRLTFDSDFGLIVCFMNGRIDRRNSYTFNKEDMYKIDEISTLDMKEYISFHKEHKLKLNLSNDLLGISIKLRNKQRIQVDKKKREIIFKIQ